MQCTIKLLTHISGSVQFSTFSVDLYQALQIGSIGLGRHYLHCLGGISKFYPLMWYIWHLNVWIQIGLVTLSYLLVYGSFLFFISSLLIFV